MIRLFRHRPKVVAAVKFRLRLTIGTLIRSSFKLEADWIRADQAPSTFATARHLPCSSKPSPYALRNGHKLTLSPPDDPVCQARVNFFRCRKGRLWPDEFVAPHVPRDPGHALSPLPMGSNSHSARFPLTVRGYGCSSIPISAQTPTGRARWISSGAPFLVDNFSDFGS